MRAAAPPGREELRRLSMDFSLSDAPGQGGGIQEAQCPHGFYREAPIVFACGEQSREVSILLGTVTIELPKGLSQFKLAMLAEGAATLTLQNASDGNSTTGTDGESQFWDEHGNQSYTLALAATGNGSATAVFTGTLPSGLSFDLTSNASGLSPATVTYSYEDVEPCPAVLPGCAVYNQHDSLELVRRWSASVSSEFNSPAEAWEALCVPALQATGAHELGSPVPFRAWPHVWSRWSDAPNGSAQAAFKFIDSIGTEDQLIEVDEFVIAYKLNGISWSTFAFCVWMRQLYSDCPDALAQVGGPSSVAGINRRTWTTQVWPRFVQDTNFTKATAHQSFAYADASSDNVISESEFCKIWDMCPGVGTPNLSREPHATEDAIATDSIEGNNTDELANFTERTTTAERTTKCCQHFSAECMACQAGVDLGDFCATSALSHLPGCDVGLSAEAFNESDVGCPYKDSRFEPPLEGPSWSAAHESACQLRCQRTLGCSYFSFRLSDSACTLHGPTAQWAPAPGHAAGPRTCTATVQLKRLDGSRTVLTDALQDAMLMDFLPSLASAVGGEVRNFGGALRPEVELPPSQTSESVSALLQGEAMRTALVESVRKVAPALVADVSKGNPFVAVVSSEDTGCLLPGTQYKGAAAQPSVETPANSSNAIECRQSCKASSSCMFFSYRNATATCLLFGPSAQPAPDTGAISGAAACATPRAPDEEEPALGAFLGASLPANPTRAGGESTSAVGGALESLGLGGAVGVNWFTGVALATFCAGVALTGLCLHHLVGVRWGRRKALPARRTSSGRMVGEKDYLYQQLAREEPPLPQRMPSGI